MHFRGQKLAKTSRKRPSSWWSSLAAILRLTWDISSHSSQKASHLTSPRKNFNLKSKFLQVETSITKPRINISTKESWRRFLRESRCPLPRGCNFPRNKRGWWVQQNKRKPAKNERYAPFSRRTTPWAVSQEQKHQLHGKRRLPKGRQWKRPSWLLKNCNRSQEVEPRLRLVVWKKTNIKMRVDRGGTIRYSYLMVSDEWNDVLNFPDAIASSF